MLNWTRTLLTLSVSSERLREIELLLEHWSRKRTATKTALQSLVGKLVFISKCVRQSRIFVARILVLLRKLTFNHHHVNLTAEFRKDIAWWRCFLRAYNGVSMISTAQLSSPGEVFTTYACLTGCGGLCGDQYFHAVFPSFPVREQHLDIHCHTGDMRETYWYIRAHTSNIRVHTGNILVTYESIRLTYEYSTINSPNKKKKKKRKEKKKRM